MRLADGESLLQKTLLRAAQLPNVTDIVTVTNRELFFKTEDEYRGLLSDEVARTYLLEPFGRNTAPAVAVASLQVQRAHGDDALVIVLPADHLISDTPAFHEAVATASQVARDGYIVTFGIHPTRPDTGFGYIEFEGTEVKRFVEKPDAETAARYLSSGAFLWNSGMFCFKAGVMLREMAAFCPEVLDGARACLDGARSATGPGLTQLELEAARFATIPEISIDYAVMERTRAAAVVPCNIGWSDIGSWNAISDLAEADDLGNRVLGEAVLHDTQNCYFQSDRLVGAVGVQDLVVIDTVDALLIAHSGKTQDVKHVYARLKAQSHDAHKLHRTVHRPWGSYSVLQESKRFKIKRIEVKPGASLSLQMHQHRSEHWIVVSGTADVVNGHQQIVLETNQSTYIPATHKHRLTNAGSGDLVMIEVQSGEYLGEDDIVRFEDNYGRA